MTAWGKKLILLWLLLPLAAHGQVTYTPNLQLAQPVYGYPGWDTLINNNFSILDSTILTIQQAYQGLWQVGQTYAKGQTVTDSAGGYYVSLINQNVGNVPATSPASWSLIMSGGGTVRSFSAGDFPPLFTSSVATPASTPALSFIPTAAAQNAFLAGPATGGSGPYLFRPVVAADVPVLNQNTTGNAATANALAAAPTLCPGGQAPVGILADGTATGCAPTGTIGGVGTTAFVPCFASATTLDTCGSQTGNVDLLVSAPGVTHSLYLANFTTGTTDTTSSLNIQLTTDFNHLGSGVQLNFSTGSQPGGVGPNGAYSTLYGGDPTSTGARYGVVYTHQSGVNVSYGSTPSAGMFPFAFTYGTLNATTGFKFGLQRTSGTGRLPITVPNQASQAAPVAVMLGVITGTMTPGDCLSIAPNVDATANMLQDTGLPCILKVATGTATINPGTAIASGACTAVVAVSATGTLTSDLTSYSYTGDPTAIVGYGASATGAVMTIYEYPTAGNINFKACNNTAASITPASITLNWKVTR
jgi:hypothetical protein